eukprot:6463673-Amphidinium_carterae.1
MDKTHGETSPHHPTHRRYRLHVGLALLSDFRSGRSLQRMRLCLQLLPILWVPLLVYLQRVHTTQSEHADGTVAVELGNQSVAGVVTVRASELWKQRDVKFQVQFQF